MDIAQGTQPISDMFIGDMGIKTVLVGSESIYERPGGFLYIELNTKESKT